MKKAIIIIIAVAILGGAGIYTKSHNDSNDLSVVKGANTTAKTLPSTKTASTTAISASSGSLVTNRSSSSISYKDGTYTGASEDTAYGTVQVAAVISSGKITDIKFLQMPWHEGRSKDVTAFSESPLKQSALTKQTAKIDFVSGATQTSEGYEQSLQAALDQAV